MTFTGTGKRVPQRIAWDAGDAAYVAAIDNEEVEDVDLFEITDPAAPELIAETGLPG